MSGVDDLEVIAIELVGSGSYYEAACRSVSIKFSRSICLPFSFSVFVGLVGELAPWLSCGLWRGSNSYWNRT